MGESKMDLNEARNAMKVGVLSDLSAICKKLANDPVVPDDLRERAREMVEEFNALAEVRGRGNATAHTLGETLLIKMARFLPSVVEIHTTPADATGVLHE
jgi:hypothetical protein